MDQVSSQPFLTPLKQIEHEKGDLYHAMKSSDAGFAGFGETYITTVHKGCVKGWKLHTVMCMNLVVPVGAVRFYLRDKSTGLGTSYLLGPANYQRLTVPPGFWMAFEGVDAGLNMVVNMASIEHDPLEATTVALDTFALEVVQ